MATPSVSHVARRSFSERTEEGRAYLQERIALFAKTMFLVVTGYFAFVLVFTSVVEEARTFGGHTPKILGLFASLGLGAMWLYARGGTRSPTVVTLLDYATVIDPGLLIGVSIYLMRELRITPFGGFAGMSLMVFGRALIVPSTAGRTAIASALGLAPVVAGTWCIAVLDPDKLAVAPTVQVVLIVAWSTVAVVVASLGSGIIYGLREQVREAQQLGQYTLLEKIGEGGMGAVYKARHAMLRRPTAIKLLPPDKAGMQQLERFEREVQHTAELTHPNTVAIFDFGHSPDGVFYYAMEHLDGIDLETLVERHGAQSPARTVHILSQVCGALSEAHGKGLIHRDIKPANVFLCHRGGVPDVVKVLDFGLVKDLQRAGASLTDVNVVSGTPGYLAPEAITKPDQVGAAADLYALGAVGYFLLTGSNVFEGATVVEICGHHVHSKPEPPSARASAAHRDGIVSSGLEPIIMRCLEKKPDRRFASARALSRELQSLPCAREWNQDDAETWWNEQRDDRAVPGPRRERATGFESTMQVDLRERQAGG